MSEFIYKVENGQLIHNLIHDPISTNRYKLYDDFYRITDMNNFVINANTDWFIKI